MTQLELAKLLMSMALMIRQDAGQKDIGLAQATFDAKLVEAVIDTMMEASLDLLRQAAQATPNVPAARA